MIRTFIAIEVPNDIISQISRAQSELRTLPGNRLSWAKPQGIHLTLKFLGEISESDVPEVIGKVKAAVENSKPFNLRTTTQGAFPDFRNPRVLWLGINQHEDLLSTQKQIDLNLKEIGFPVEKRNFHPHLTICRVKMLNSESDMPEKFKSWNFNPVEWHVNEILVMSSVLKPTGADYSALAKVSFGG